MAMQAHDIENMIRAAFPKARIAITDLAGEPAEVSRTALRPGSAALCEELRQAQHDTTNPDRFEDAVQAAFEALGFEAERIGGSGEADVVARASLETLVASGTGHSIDLRRVDPVALG